MVRRKTWGDGSRVDDLAVAPARVLLVDDDSEVLEALSGMVRALGHLVDTAGSGDEAYELLQNRSYDLALVDVIMPGMDGLSLLARIRVLRPLVPVIMVSGEADRDMVRQGLKLGAADFLFKPVMPDPLKVAIDEALDKRARKEAEAVSMRYLVSRADAVSASMEFEQPELERERQRVLAAMEAANGVKKVAAGYLGISYSTFRRLLIRLGMHEVKTKGADSRDKESR